MKKIFVFGFFVASFVSLAILISAAGATSVAHADPAGTANGAACDLVFGSGKADGVMQDGTCVAPSAYVSQSNPQTGTAPAGSSGFTALAPIPGLTDAQTTSVLDGNALATFFNNLYKYLIGLAATLAVIEIIWAGLEISFFQKDSVSAIVDNKGRIYNAIFGLILVLSPYLVFSIINPSILNLSLNLPKIVLDIPAGGASSGGTTPVPDPVSGCSAVSGTAGILQVATCPSSAAATTWGNNNCTAGNLSDGPQTALANGTVTSAIKICAGKNPYVFINTLGTLSGATSIAMLQPLARTTDNPNNGASVMQFVNTCNTSLGWKTCISRAPALGWATDCQPTPSSSLPQGTGIGKCYNETVTCENKNIISNDTCSASPSWSPFQ